MSIFAPQWEPLEVVFRADASTKIGSGHVIRCLTLAKALRQRKIRCGFVCRELMGNLIPGIEQAGFPVLRLPADCNAAVVSKHAPAPSPNWNEIFNHQTPVDLAETSSAVIAGVLSALRREMGWISSKAPSAWNLAHSVPLETESSIDWLIVDHYSIDYRWEHAIRSFFEKLMVIDDKADRDHDCDLLLDQNLVANWQSRYQARVSSGCRLMLGPQFALLQPEYAALRSSIKLKDKPLRRVLVYFGAADQRNVTGRVIAAIKKLKCSSLTTDVVISPSSAWMVDVGNQSEDTTPSSTFSPFDNDRFTVVNEGMNNRSMPVTFEESANLFQVHRSLPTLAPLMAMADLTIGAGGATTWERCCLGLPSIVISIADNQEPIADYLNQSGVVRYLGDQEFVGEQEIFEALKEIVDKGIGAEWQLRCFDLVDGRGAQRAVSCMLLDRQTPLEIRDVETGDERLILNWANEHVVRQNSFNGDAIDCQRHHRWFHAKLRNQSGSEFWIVQTEEGLALAQVRFDRLVGEPECWQFHYSLAQYARGLGLAGSIVRLSLEIFEVEHPGVIVMAEVKPTNARSVKVLENSGFKIMETRIDRLIFQIELAS